MKLKLCIFLILLYTNITQSSHEYATEEIAVFPFSEKVIECKGNDIHWFREQEEILFKSRRTHRSKFNLKFSHAGSELLIKNFTKSDSGSYRCLNKLATKTFILRIYDQLQIIDTETHYNFHEGASASLRCTTSGYPSAQSIEWYHNALSHVEVFHENISRKSDELQFANIKRSQNGIYICVAQQRVDRTLTIKQINFHVNILHPPTILRISDDGATEIITKSPGDSFTLKCKVESYPASVFIWSFNEALIVDENIKSFNFQSTLSVRVTLDHHYGVYTCRAFNQLGSDFINFRVVRKEGKTKEL